MNALEGIINSIENLAKRIGRIESQGQPRWVYVLTPLTSTSWDSDSYSTTAKTLIDLSTVFGVPAGIRAVLINVAIRDSGSATNDVYLILSPNNTAGNGLATRLSKVTNDIYHNETHIIPCDTNGDIYYQIAASGATTMDVYLEIWGYMI